MGSQEVLIEAQQLTKKFDDFTAVDHIDFKVYRGECVGFWDLTAQVKLPRFA